MGEQYSARSAIGQNSSRSHNPRGGFGLYQVAEMEPVRPFRTEFLAPPALASDSLRVGASQAGGGNGPRGGGSPANGPPPDHRL